MHNLSFRCVSTSLPQHQSLSQINYVDNLTFENLAFRSKSGLLPIFPASYKKVYSILFGRFQISGV